MKALCFHSYVADVAGKDQQILSIFVACHNVTEQEFDEAIVNALSKVATTIDAVHVVGFEEDVDRIRGWVQSDDNVLRGRFENLVGAPEHGIRFISFDQRQGRYFVADLHAQPIDIEGLLGFEQQETLLAAFRDGGGEQRAPVGTHYAKTSDSHADRFLRVSNVIEEGGNVCLIAFWLVGHLWNIPLRYIVVDTSGIYSIAAKAMHEAAVRGGLNGQPLLWSHRSHDGVDTIARHHAADSLFLISASTSGGLARRLVAQGAESSRLITLFSLSSPTSTPGRVLCDLRGANGNGLKAIENHNEADCPFCDRQYHLIRIQGDQFAIAPPNVTSVEIRATDLPSEFKSTLSSLLGLRVFSVCRRREDLRICTIGADVIPILEGELSEKNQGLLTRKRAEWLSLVRRSSTISLRHIVACSYPRSSEIAEDIAQKVCSSLREADRPRVLSPEQLRSATPEGGTSTLVVSPCIDEGKELLSVSRTLRDVQENGSTTYLAVLSMIGSRAEAERLRSNLTFGQHGPNTFSMHSLISLPIDCYEDELSWVKELQELQRIQSFADRNDLDVPAKLEARIARLQQAPAEGLVDDLFWPAADDRELALRSDFSLLADARRSPAATQADLFVVTSLILCQLRMNAEPGRRLSYSAYERAVLSPDNFDRFNDGVLQACLLRAARPKELGYAACDVAISERMLNVLLHTLPGQEVSERSEALMEFLIALAMRRLSLHTGHLLEFCRRVVASGVAEESAMLTAQYLIERESRAATSQRQGEASESFNSVRMQEAGREQKDAVAGDSSSQLDLLQSAPGGI
jgi:hypothetical protein